MGLKNDFATFKRKADLKLERLREVVEKLQRGEQVDVEKVLGTGDEIQEQEWEDALRELQEQDRIWQNNAKQSSEEKERLVKEEQDANPVNDALDKTSERRTTALSATPGAPSSPGFY